jgi:Carboxypeptidase regulatory-like domain
VAYLLHRSHPEEYLIISAPRRWTTLLRSLAIAALLELLGALQVTAQEIRGRVVDALSGAAVSTAGVFLLGEDREQVAVSIADSAGRFLLRVPRPGRYYLRAQRLGYEELESPLVQTTRDVAYEVDLEMTPEPVGLDPFTVVVRNEQMTDWLRLRLGVHPNALFGFRAFQGEQLGAAKLKSDDNTEMLRWLFIPISHGRRVCLVSPIDGCGRLYVDNIWMPNEHIDSIDMESIVAVVTFIRPPSVWLFTAAFDWGRRPRR